MMNPQPIPLIPIDKDGDQLPLAFWAMRIPVLTLPLNTKPFSTILIKHIPLQDGPNNPGWI